MGDFTPSENPTHPLGWAFLGAGAATWLFPASTLVGFDLRNLLPSEPFERLAVLAITASALGILLEQILIPCERLLLNLSREQKSNPSQEAWVAAWQLRWRYPNADAEFRRHEALASFARVYLIHFVFAGALGSILAFREHYSLCALTLIAGGALLAWTCYRLWKRQTRLIFRLVENASTWKRDDALG